VNVGFLDGGVTF